MKIRNTVKPIYFFLLLIALLIGFVFASTLTGDSVSAIKGAQNVSFPIFFDNDESVIGFQVAVNYSTSFLTLQNVEAISRLSNATIVFNDQQPIVKIAVLVNNESDKIDPGSGPVLNLIFNVDSAAVPDNYTVNLSELIVANISAIALDVSEIPGVFEIVDPYNFTFLPPITNFENFTLQQGATLPLKFNVTLDENFVSDDSVLVRVYNVSLGIDKTYNASGIGNDYIDIQESQYLVNIHTGQLNMSEGIYNIDVTFNNYQIELIGFELIDKSQGVGKGRQR